MSTSHLVYRARELQACVLKALSFIVTLAPLGHVHQTNLILIA